MKCRWAKYAATTALRCCAGCWEPDQERLLADGGKLDEVGEQVAEPVGVREKGLSLLSREGERELLQLLAKNSSEACGRSEAIRHEPQAWRQERKKTPRRREGRSGRRGGRRRRRTRQQRTERKTRKGEEGAEPPLQLLQVRPQRLEGQRPGPQQSIDSTSPCPPTWGGSGRRAAAAPEAVFDVAVAPRPPGLWWQDRLRGGRKRNLALG